MAKTVTADGLDYKNGKFVKKKLTIKLAPEGSVTAAGKPITLKAVKAMTDGYLLPKLDRLKQLRAKSIGKSKEEKAEEKALLESNIAVFFGKETLMLLLSQTDCEGIRFYFCRNHEKKQSLVLVGVDGAKNDLGIHSKHGSIIDRNLDINDLQEDIPADEVGGPKSLQDYLNDNKLIGDPVGDAIKEYLN